MAKLHDKRTGPAPEVETRAKDVPFPLARVEADMRRRVLKAVERMHAVADRCKRRFEPSDEDGIELASATADLNKLHEEYVAVHRLIWNKYWILDCCDGCQAFLPREHHSDSLCDVCAGESEELLEIRSGLKGMAAVEAARRRLKK